MTTRTLSDTVITLQADFDGIASLCEVAERKVNLASSVRSAVAD